MINTVIIESIIKSITGCPYSDIPNPGQGKFNVIIGLIIKSGATGHRIEINGVFNT
jgi:hypothetical protein